MTADRREKDAVNACRNVKEEKTSRCCSEGSNPTEKKNIKTNHRFTLEVTETDKVCAIGDVFGRKCQQEKKIPVFSCEGGCVKGEIARLATNLVAKDDPYERACHGELFSAPHSDLAKWVKDAERVVVIDGCAIHCHGRIAENIIEKNKLVNINALSIHGKYADLMGIDDVPEKERKRTARDVAEKILVQLKKAVPHDSEAQSSCGSR